MTDEDHVVMQYKSLQLHGQDMIRAYYEGNVMESMDALDLLLQRAAALRYALFQCTHTSGSKG